MLSEGNMTTKTLRNIPDDIARKVRILSERQRRSENQQMLVLLEEALELEAEKAGRSSAYISVETQVRLWKELAGRWNDDRSTKAIIEDIYRSRTPGREVDL
jgi:plasmid stability protein